jgi:hypothetical protein
LMVLGWVLYKKTFVKRGTPIAAMFKILIFAIILGLPSALTYRIVPNTVALPLSGLASVT